MPKYKVTGTIECAGTPALQNGLTAELVSNLPLTVETTLSRKVQVSGSPGNVYLVLEDTSRFSADRISSLLTSDEAREIAEALLEAAGEKPRTPSVVTDNDGDDWVLQSDGTYTRVFSDGQASSWDHSRSLAYIRSTYGIRSEQ